jgi:hypothetical protein
LGLLAAQICLRHVHSGFKTPATCTDERSLTVDQIRNLMFDVQKLIVVNRTLLNLRFPDFRTGWHHCISNMMTYF